MRLLWLLGQFALVVGFGATMITAVIGIYYAISMLVLLAVSRLFALRGRGHDPE